MSASPTGNATPSSSSSGNTSIPSHPTSSTAATTGYSHHHSQSLCWFLDKQQRQRLVAETKPNQVAKMRTRLAQMRDSDEPACIEDPEVLLKLWHARVNGEISPEGPFTPEEVRMVLGRLRRGEFEAEGGAVGGPLVAWGQGLGGSIFGGRLPDGLVADRSGAVSEAGGAHTRQHTRTARQQAEEQDAFVAGVGSWTVADWREYGEREAASLAIETEVVEQSTYPLISASPLA